MLSSLASPAWRVRDLSLRRLRWPNWWGRRGLERAPGTLIQWSS